jgi:hypothetical protein
VAKTERLAFSFFAPFAALLRKKMAWSSTLRLLRTRENLVVGVRLKVKLHALCGCSRRRHERMNAPFRLGAFPSHLLNAGSLAGNLKVGKIKVGGLSLRDRGAAML